MTDQAHGMTDQVHGMTDQVHRDDGLGDGDDGKAESQFLSALVLVWPRDAAHSFQSSPISTGSCFAAGLVRRISSNNNNIGAVVKIIIL
jgi:hypothetical protein